MQSASPPPLREHPKRVQYLPVIHLRRLRLTHLLLQLGHRLAQAASVKPGESDWQLLHPGRKAEAKDSASGRIGQDGAVDA